VECCLGKAVKDSSELHPAIEEIEVYNPTTSIQVLNKAMAVADKVLNVQPVPEFNPTTVQPMHGRLDASLVSVVQW
ncbi:hypothetical protein Tco_1527665, partial [Tanacetum coccineum]